MLTSSRLLKEKRTPEVLGGEAGCSSISGLVGLKNRGGETSDKELELTELIILRSLGFPGKTKF